MRPTVAAFLLATVALSTLTGCDQLGIESSEKIAAAKEADGKAIGSACRQAGRALEDCYGMNPKAQRAAVFAGWREMDEYMRDNKLDVVAPTVARGSSKPSRSADLANAEPAADATEDGERKPAKSKAQHGT